MSKRTKVIAIGTSLAIAAGGAGVAVAAGGGEDAAEGPDVAITGGTLANAEAAALEATGEGEVTGTETGDEESYYEVEVTLDDGSAVDVQLDRDLNVVDQTADSENDE